LLVIQAKLSFSYAMINWIAHCFTMFQVFSCRHTWWERSWVVLYCRSFEILPAIPLWLLYPYAVRCKISSLMIDIFPILEMLLRGILSPGMWH